MRTPSRMIRRAVSTIAVSLPLVLAVSLVGAGPVLAAPVAPSGPPASAKVKPIAVVPVRATVPAVPAYRPASAKPAPAWPGASSTRVSVAPAGQRAAAQAAGPVTVTAAAGAPAAVTVDVLGQADSARAGIRGVLVRLARADGVTGNGRVNVAVSYKDFATAYGGDWSSRLRLVSLPECAVTSPGRPECVGTVLASDNDTVGKVVSADVPVGTPARDESARAGGSTLVALTAGVSGAAGSFAATSLSPSSTWSAGNYAGDFSWSYPMRVPPAVGGPEPSLDLGYSSQSVDGRMAASNNQPTEIGEGFDLSIGGYVERRYRNCWEDRKNGGNNTTKTGDQCWATDNATVNLGGRSLELIQDATDVNRWHPRKADGSRVERRYGAPNGARNGEWWVLTTSSGTQYWFGKNMLPGAPSNKPTGSVWTMPVFGNHVNEPCNQTTYNASWCTQAWRWNLDYVVDPHNNTMSFWYSSNTNHYAKNMVVATPVSYVRGGRLDRVEYGTRVEPDPTTGTDSVFAGNAAARVLLGYGDRCLSNCGTHNETTWPDTPWDLECASATKECLNASPSFWTTNRLSTVTTQVRNSAPNDFRDVERWTLTHGFPDPEDSTRAGLWLEKISHVGLVGGTTAMPDITFEGEPMHNRVDTVDHSPSMNWRRLVGIYTETGGLVQIDYSDPDCVAGTRVPTVPESNTLRCYPVKWTPEGHTTAKTDYFHKYVVDAVTESDLTGGAPRVVNRYTYLGDPAWHFADDDGLLSEDGKTWSSWRGYGRVGTTVGDPGEQTYSETTYFRGMNGDKGPSGTTRSVSVTDSQGGTFVDEDWYAGMVREQRTFNGPGGAEVSGSLSEPWHSAELATRTIAGAKVASRYVDVRTSESRTARDGGRPAQRTRTVKEFDSYGMAVKVDDLGDVDVTGDEQCSTTTYEPRNTTAWIIGLPHGARSYALSCAAAAGTVTADDVVSATRTSYDGQDPGIAPKRGDVTRMEQMTGWANGQPVFSTVARAAFDSHGRTVESWDALNFRSATTYTPASGGPVTQTVDTNALNWTTTSTIEPAWGLSTSTEDVNGLRSSLAYDSLGRLTGVWKPGKTKGVDPADVKYTYTVRRDGATAVTTDRVGPTGAYLTSYTLYDGMLRQRQTQSASPSGGRLLTDTFYDTAGRAVKAYDTYHNTGTPGIDLVGVVAADTIPKQTRTVYDGAGRATDSIFQPYERERWRTHTVHGGDHTTVVPPQGGTATTRFVDARGHTTRARTYMGSTPTGAHADTTYEYNRRGLLSTVTDPAGNRWVFGYDITGRQTTLDDPDSGTLTTTYDAGGRVATSTDARNRKLLYTYDAFGRRTGIYKDALAATNKIVEWIYDQTTLPDQVTKAKGQLTSATRIVGNDRYTVATTGYNLAYQKTGTSISIPMAEGGVGGTYYYNAGYNRDGSANSLGSPETGDLPVESVGFTYTDLGLPNRMTNFLGSAPQASYVSDTRYNALAEPEQLTLYRGLFSETGSRVYRTFKYELETGRLEQVITARDGADPNTVSDITYDYDDVGKVTRIADSPPGATADVQCFRYDGLQRLTGAWTPRSGDCAATPTAAGLGGPAPYRQSWTYDDIGRRLTQTDHSLTSDTQAVTTAYDYPNDGGDQPHTLTGVTRSADGASVTTGYTYDAAGNTLNRPAPGGELQTLTWDHQGHLASTNDPTGETSYVYSATGDRLIRRDAKGKTLYLPDAELRWDRATNSKTCTRFYNFGGTTVAQRTAAGVTWLGGDHHGTQQIAIAEAGQAVTRRYETPFGAERGTPTLWPNEKGFVGGTKDPTGLTHLGAREYDPAIGRFVSIDTIVDFTDPQQMNGYTYANNAPTAASDADGLKVMTDEEWYGNTPTYTSDGTGGGGGGGGGNGGGGKKDGGKGKSKKCGTWDIVCKGKKAATATVNWVDDHKAAIAGFAAGLVVGVGCGFAIGWTGAGAVACGALAGAVGSAVQYAVETKVEGKGEFSWGGLAKQAAVGAVIGAVTGGLGSAGAQGIKAGVSAAVAGQGAKAATKAAGAAAWKEAGEIATGKVTGGALSRGAGSAGAAKAGGGKGGGGGKGCSFTAGATVLMADGSGKPIEKIAVGDLVVASGPDNGTTAQPVTATITGTGDRELVQITVETGGTDGPATITATDNHPFWVLPAGEWVDAKDLQPGQWLQTSAGTRVEIGAVQRAGQAGVTTYNLTVAVTHTYHVLAADQPVLVHNCGGPNCQCSAEGLPSYSRPGGWQTAHGPARDYAARGGPTLNWEHVVEQSQAAKSGFPLEWINHPDNMMLLESTVNFAKNGYYSKTFNWTGGQSIRNMLAGMPFNQQWDFGMYVINTIRTYGKEALPGNLPGI
ncbi:polymorphic toxin-type HINT domain-containing protein [Virgisporangium aurantiacum]|uniref:Type IV secretion protein Rhs n=1 Tax=Virgisporangium aurantiacum TaxID=175570 RepID=A0A8J3ZHF9_9ACTN|nr:polymorphic toxin-type HINT domain-containing protein [Virgisporangium aurantiacum]GIJ62977.1 type IV secretion protein Rhs [Virgisporangium aurantiacum]